MASSCGLLSSADNLCKQCGPRSGRQNVGPDLDPNCLTLWWYSWKIFLKKFIKKIHRWQKSTQNYPACNELTFNTQCANLAEDKMMVLFLVFLENRLWNFMQKLSPKQKICMKCQSLRSGKKYEKYFEMSFVEILPSMLNICAIHASYRQYFDHSRDGWLSTYHI